MGRAMTDGKAFGMAFFDIFIPEAFVQQDTLGHIDFG